MPLDRNQATRQREQAQRELQQQLQKFARDLSAAKTGVVDRFGVAVTPGTYVLYRPAVDLIYEVVDVVPILDMSRPAGHVTIRLVCQTDVEFVAGVRAMTLVKCGEKAAAGEAAIQPPGSRPPGPVEVEPLPVTYESDGESQPPAPVDEDTH